MFQLHAGGNKESLSNSANPYIGDGGKNISITIKVLSTEVGLPASWSNIGELAYRRLIDNFKKYSAMFIRQDLEFDISIYE
jgi:hypothetical protein